ncbi:5988_t:CDS:1 [Scutellospora calospora]|uniref:5988_t:CDS:1 n=1 Tax=Scutellospora calospora TaxID=85575 RepID=A0ACA9JV37_9GLOM|nr:5988_t:CDS:1 [Scutellospora calospora]
MLNNLPTCSHTDYDLIKQDYKDLQVKNNSLEGNINQLQNQNQKQAAECKQHLAEKEAQIRQKFIEDLKLTNLDKTASVEKIITTIQQLIRKDPIILTEELSKETIQEQLTEAQSTIIRLEKELGEKNADVPFEENLGAIKQADLELLTKIFSEEQIPDQVRQEIAQATTYQQVVAARQAFLEKHLGQEQNKIQAVNQISTELSQPVNKERIIWIGLLITALLTIGGLLMKLRGKKK